MYLQRGEIESQKEQERRLQQAMTEPGRPPGRPVCARSTGVHDVHMHGTVDRPVDRGKGMVDQAVDRLT